MLCEGYMKALYHFIYGTKITVDLGNNGIYREKLLLNIEGQLYLTA